VPSSVLHRDHDTFDLMPVLGSEHVLADAGAVEAVNDGGQLEAKRGLGE
jgi:hypothetical protein